MCPGLFPNSPALFRKQADSQNRIYVMEGEIIGLGNVLEFFKESRGVNGRRPSLFSYLREFTYEERTRTLIRLSTPATFFKGRTRPGEAG